MKSRYAWIEAHRGQHSVEKMVHLLRVSRSAYYASRKAVPSPRKQEEEHLKAEIQQTFAQSRRRYGSPRIHQVLRQQGYRVGHNRVARLMRVQGLQAVPKRRWTSTTQSQHRLPVAENVLNRDFQAAGPNEKWASDLTYLPTSEGWLYLAVVLDLYSRQVVGWSLGADMRTELVLDALDMAVKRRRPGPGLLFHSDRGSQYASVAFRERLQARRMLQSMSRRGNCWDNACVESFFGSLKQEAYRQPLQTRKAARLAVFEYIEGFYNPHRLHSTLGYLSPIQFERRVA